MKPAQSSITTKWWVRLALSAFPRQFRDRQEDDLVATLDDLLHQTAPADRRAVSRRVFADLVKAGVAERLAPSPSPVSYSTHSRSPLMDDLTQDLKSAFRSVTRRPAFAALVVATLAIGFGTSAAMFGVINGVLLKPLPFDEPERLVMVMRHFTNDPGREEENMSLPDLRDLQASSTTLETSAGYGRTRMTILRDGLPSLVVAGRLTDGLLDVFGTNPHLGRDLAAADAELEAPKVVVLSHRFWQSRFAGDPGVVGQALDLSGTPHTIVGVAPVGFDFPGEVELWVPWQIDPEGCGRSCHMIDTIARLSSDSGLEITNRELEVLGSGLAAQYPESNTHKRFFVRQLQEQQVAPVQSALWMLMGAVSLLVLIAAANVANLVMVRGERRKKELAIRTAVGAGKLRLFRQLMLENGMLALAGAAAGLGIGHLVLKGLLTMAPPDLPRLDRVGLDGDVFLFTIGLALVVLMLFGWLPAARSADADLRGRGQTGTLKGARSRRFLLTAEVALTLVLLLGAGLLLRSFIKTTEVELGFSPERVTRFSFALPDAGYPKGEDAVRFSEQLERRLSGTPGIEAAGLAFTGPFGSSQITSTLEPKDRPKPLPGEELKASYDVVSPGFFETLGIPILHGRSFTADDTRGAPLVLVISQTLAERYFPGRNPIGERAEVGVGFDFDDEGEAYTIVGVAADIRAYSLTDQPEPAVYMAQAQTGSPYLSGFVRTHQGVDVEALVREQLAAVDPMLPLRSFETQDAAIEDAYGPQRFYMALLASFAGIALLLSAVGLYGVVAFLVSQRTRELAVRKALGADSLRVLRLVLADALQPAAVGTVIGLIGAFLGAGALEKLLYGITAYDAVTYLAAPSLLFLFALLACVAPAARAAKLEPRIALEEE